jgi:hypothetical protein
MKALALALTLYIIGYIYLVQVISDQSVMSLHEEIISLTQRGNRLRFLGQLQEHIEQVIN